jgi:uncharacterized protein YgbK (DUF1537 family)
MTLAADRPVGAEELLAGLPPEWPDETLREQVQALLARSGEIVVSLDDDPTGVQTVHDIVALIEPDTAAIEREFAAPRTLFAVLTNSRAGDSIAASAGARTLAADLAAASLATGRRFAVISRSDSTLRGHYPAETDALASALGPFAGTLLIPAFFEGGRITVDDIHFVREGDHFTPAALTEFARDRVFGYTQSNLRQYVAEKTGGRVPASAVASLSLDLIRRAGPRGVADALRAVAGNQPVVVNAASDRDLEVVSVAVLTVEAEGQRFLSRTAASWLRTRAGIAPRPPLRGADLPPRNGPGLVIAGSYVGRTSEQLDALLAPGDLTHFTLPIAPLLDTRRPEFIEAARRALADTLGAGHDAVLFTAREHVAGATDSAGLAIGRAVSTALVEILARLTETTRPGFLIAKGGITSHDLAAHGLDAHRIEVLGQLLPGVPLWRMGSETRLPGLLYVVFPGNVGGPGALREGFEVLRQA